MHSISVELAPQDNTSLIRLCGYHNKNLNMLESRFNVQIKSRGFHFTIEGEKSDLNKPRQALQSLYELARVGELDSETIYATLAPIAYPGTYSSRSKETIRVGRKEIKPCGPGQLLYIQRMRSFDINFAIGPAGTGKTFLAVAAALQALELAAVKRIILTRPAIEAGEKLGFLPGDLSQKIDPYLSPLFDALHSLIGSDRAQKLMDQGHIEIAPIAFMRGRTLNDSFLILDEAQNTTVGQMKMFLTRMGFHSRAAIAGDVSQIDLPKISTSGLEAVQQVLRDVEGITFTHFDSADVVRHPLVREVINAFDRYKVSS